ncbi:28150_t:CDS:2, partial [Dentiscutata erythropus]
ENKLLSNFSSKETNDDKWKILEFKFANMTREEKFDKRGLILRLDIKRLIEILEKIEPNLVNSWLQNFIDSIDINENDSFYNTKLRIKQLEYIIYNELIPNLYKVHYGSYSVHLERVCITTIKIKSLQYCSKQAPMINYYNNDPVSEAINESESDAKLKNNFVEIQNPDYQTVSETIIKAQHGNSDDADEQIDNRIIEIQQGINIVKDIIKVDCLNFRNWIENTNNEIVELLEEINSENTKLNVKLWGPTAYEDGIKQVNYSCKNKIKPPGRLRSFCSTTSKSKVESKSDQFNITSIQKIL